MQQFDFDLKHKKYFSWTFGFCKNAPTDDEGVI